MSKILIPKDNGLFAVFDAWKDKIILDDATAEEYVEYCAGLLADDSRRMARAVLQTVTDGTFDRVISYERAQVLAEKRRQLDMA